MLKRTIKTLCMLTMCVMVLIPLYAVTTEDVNEKMTLIIKPRGEMNVGVSLTLPAEIADAQHSASGMLDEFHEEADGTLRVSGTFYPFIDTNEPKYEVRMFAGPITYTGVQDSNTPSPASLPSYSIKIADNIALINGNERYTNIEDLQDGMQPVTVNTKNGYSDVIISDKDTNKWKKMQIDMYLSWNDNHVFYGAEFSGTLKMEVRVLK